MKKSLQLLLMLCVFMLGTQVSFASGLLGGTGVAEKTVFDADSLVNVETLAIANSIYNGPNTEGEPEIEDLPEILMEGTLADKKNVLSYISYRDVAQNIKVSRHVDILRLDRKKAFSEYKNNIAMYADAYVVTTISNGTSKNDGTRLNVFYDVYNAKTNKIIYGYRKLAPKDATRDAMLYTEITKDFINDFISDRKSAIEAKEKEEKAILKADKEAAKKAEKEAKAAAKG